MKNYSSLLQSITKGLYEREESVALAFLSAMAGESIFLLGLPGVGKSLIGRRLKLIFKEATSFEYLMSRFSTPDEIFGPVSITQLKDNDIYERKIDGYLPTSDVVFLDEIWKAGPSIQNSLLTVLNEKIYRNGLCDIKLPLKGIIAASNELPAKNEGLEALWDRFLIRVIVKDIKSKKMFNQMISSTQEMTIDVDSALQITTEQYNELQQAIDKIKIEPFVFEVIDNIRTQINEYNIEPCDDVEEKEVIIVSDRRWKKIIRLLRTSALINGRAKIDISDLAIIQHCIWSEETHIQVADKIVASAICKQILDTLSEELIALETKAKELLDIKTQDASTPVLYNNTYYNIKGLCAGRAFIDKSVYNSITDKWGKEMIISRNVDDISNIELQAKTMAKSNQSSAMDFKIYKVDNGIIYNNKTYLFETLGDSQMYSTYQVDSEIELFKQKAVLFYNNVKLRIQGLKYDSKSNLFCTNQNSITRELKRLELRCKKLTTL